MHLNRIRSIPPPRMPVTTRSTVHFWARDSWKKLFHLPLLKVDGRSSICISKHDQTMVEAWLISCVLVQSCIHPNDLSSGTGGQPFVRFVPVQQIDGVQTSRQKDLWYSRIPVLCGLGRIHAFCNWSTWRKFSRGVCACVCSIYHILFP